MVAYIHRTLLSLLENSTPFLKPHNSQALNAKRSYWNESTTKAVLKSAFKNCQLGLRWTLEQFAEIWSHFVTLAFWEPSGCNYKTLCYFLSVFKGGNKGVGGKASSAQSPLVSGRTSVFFQVCTAVLHIIHLVMIIVYNLHNSDNLCMHLQISNSTLVIAQFSFDGIRRMVFHVPAYLPLHNLNTSYQSPNFDKRKGDAPMSEYADSRFTVVSQFSFTWQFFFFLAQHRQSKFIIQIKTVIIFW